MKNIVIKSFAFAIAVIAAIGMLFLPAVVGCKTAPSEDALYATSYSIGVSSSLVLNQTKLDDTSRNAIIDIVKKVNEAVPQTNDTFTATWTPIASEHLERLLSEEKVNLTQSKIIKTAFNAVSQTLDYIVYKRYLKVGENVSYIIAVAHGFSDGFLTNFTPVTLFTANSTYMLYDFEAYEHMLKLMK